MGKIELSLREEDGKNPADVIRKHADSYPEIKKASQLKSRHVLKAVFLVRSGLDKVLKPLGLIGDKISDIKKLATDLMPSVSLPALPELPKIPSLPKLKRPTIPGAVSNIAHGLTFPMRFAFRNKVISTTIALSAVGTCEIYSRNYATDVLSRVSERTAVAISTIDPDSTSEVGYIYGGRLNAPEFLQGHDMVIQVTPEDLKLGGPLYFYYKGLMHLEDKGHDGGLSDYLGVNPVGIAREGFKAVLGKPHGGGSTISDQVCGQIMEPYPEYRKSSRWMRKIKDSACALGLAHTKTPAEIAALYATFVYLGKHAEGVERFSGIYWGHGVHDPQMTVGKQLILASLPKRVWNVKSNKERKARWEQIKDRALLAAKRIIENNEKEPAPFELLMLAYGKTTKEDILRLVEEDIDKAFPRTKIDRNFQPRDGYNYPITLAQEQAEKTFGEDWRSLVAEIQLTVDPNTQGQLVLKCESALEGVGKNANCWGGVVDENGDVIAIHSGDANRNSIVERGETPRLPASIGKMLLAFGVAREGHSPDSKKIKRFLYYLMRSNNKIAREARKIGVDAIYVKSLIECLGGEVNFGDDPFELAAKGQFRVTNRDLIRFLLEGVSGKQVDRFNIVKKYIMYDGREVDGINPQSPHLNEDREQDSPANSCYSLTRAHGKLACQYLAKPLDPRRGTLRVADTLECGKTGTLGQVGESTKRAGAIGLGVLNDGTKIAGLVFVGSDDSTDIGKHASGGKTAGPVLDAVVKKAQERLGK